MNTYKIYLAGKMSGLKYEDQTRWRNYISERLKSMADDKSHIQIINPPLYYSPKNATTASEQIEEPDRFEREAMIWDLSQIRSSDIVVVNLYGIESSIGTLMEIGYICAMNTQKEKHTYVVGFGCSNIDDLHPWIKFNLFHFEPDIDSAAEYIANFLIL